MKNNLSNKLTTTTFVSTVTVDQKIISIKTAMSALNRIGKILEDAVSKNRKID